MYPYCIRQTRYATARLVTYINPFRTRGESLIVLFWGCKLRLLERRECSRVLSYNIVPI